MRFRQLLYVDRVIQHGTMREAARQLFTSEPTISQQIHELESEVGFSIFEKKGRSVQVTAEGEIILPFIRNILFNMGELEKTIADIKDPDSGSIRVGTVPTGALTLLPSILPRFNQQWPKVSLEVYERGSVELTDQILSNKLDVALIAARTKNPIWNEELDVRVLSRGKLMAVVSENHPRATQASISLIEIKHERLIMFRTGYLVRDMVLEALGPQCAANVVYSTDNSESARNLVRAGVCIVLLPSHLISHWSPNERVGLLFLSIDGADLGVDLCLIYRKSRYRPNYLREFIRMILSQRSANA